MYLTSKYVGVVNSTPMACGYPDICMTSCVNGCTGTCYGKCSAGCYGTCKATCADNCEHYGE